MNAKTTMKRAAPRSGASLIERAAEHYDLSVPLRGGTVIETPEPVAAKPEPVTTPVAAEPIVEAAARAEIIEPAPAPITEPVSPEPATFDVVHVPAADGAIDRERLAAEGFIVPEASPSVLAEEFRLVKRRLLRTAPGAAPRLKDRLIMICSAQPDEGKTFCSVNLALSLASERDTEVLLIDADLAKPEVLSTLGLAGTAGLMDAIADPAIDVEDLIVHTDVPKLTVLPAGRATNDDTELLASGRAAEVLRSLAEANERRIIIIDSAPALAASPASVLAHHVGRVVMVVRADRTTEGELRDAIALLDGCPDISLLLNGASYFGSNRTFGSYYGQEK